MNAENTNVGLPYVSTSHHTLQHAHTNVVCKQSTLNLKYGCWFVNVQCRIACAKKHPAWASPGWPGLAGAGLGWPGLAWAVATGPAQTGPKLAFFKNANEKPARASPRQTDDRNWPRPD